MPFDYKTGYEQYKRYYLSIGKAIQKPKNRVYSTTVFSFLAISLFGWYAIRPTIQTILFLQREIKDNQMVNQQMEEKISALIEAQNTYQEIQPQLYIVEQALPTPPDIIELVAQLRNLAAFSQASLSAIQVPTVPLLGIDATRSAQTVLVRGPNAPKQSKLGDFPVSVTVNGTFTNIQSFLQGIIAMRRITTVDILTIAPSKNSSIPAGTNMLQLTLRLKGYYLTQ